MISQNVLTLAFSYGSLGSKGGFGVVSSIYSIMAKLSEIILLSSIYKEGTNFE
jgi:hypothetical protein